MKDRASPQAPAPVLTKMNITLTPLTFRWFGWPGDSPVIVELFAAQP